MSTNLFIFQTGKVNAGTKFPSFIWVIQDIDRNNKQLIDLIEFLYNSKGDVDWAHFEECLIGVSG